MTGREEADAKAAAGGPAAEGLAHCAVCGGVLDERGADICPTGGHCPAAATGEPALEWREHGDYWRATRGVELELRTYESGWAYVISRRGVPGSIAAAKAEAERIYRAAFGPRLSQAERDALRRVSFAAAQWIANGVIEKAAGYADLATLAPLLEAK